LVILVWFINMLGAKLAHADAIADDAWRHISTKRSLRLRLKTQTTIPMNAAMRIKR
jgi:hypothetical protein